MPPTLGAMPVSLLAGVVSHDPAMPTWLNSPEHHGEVMNINTISLLPLQPPSSIEIRGTADFSWVPAVWQL